MTVRLAEKRERLAAVAAAAHVAVVVQSLLRVVTARGSALRRERASRRGRGQGGGIGAGIGG